MSRRNYGRRESSRAGNRGSWFSTSTGGAGGSAFRARNGDLVLSTTDIGTGSVGDPARIIAKQISAALDPAKAPGKVRRLADMTPEERAELERLYGRKG